MDGIYMGALSRAKIKLALALTLVTPILVIATATTASAIPKSSRISIVYVPPKVPAHQKIYERMKTERTLERLRSFLSPFRLPRTLKVSLQECDGEADAWYEDAKITLCYEYINDLWKNMPAKATEGGIEPIDTVIGPLFDTCLHEFAHAIFDLLDIPILGREEDAADQVAAAINLRLGKAVARKMVLGTAWAYWNEAERSELWKPRQYADEHSTPAQRAYNVICLAYGADPKTFGDLLTRGLLPPERAEACGDEYEQVADAFEVLIAPHLNRALARKVLSVAWLPKPAKPTSPKKK